MAKKESTFLNMVLTLFLVTGISALTLGYVYNVTKGPIEAAKQEKLNSLIGIVVPGASDAEVSDKIEVIPADGDELSEPLLFYKVHKDGELIGTAIRTYTNRGFSGYISVMVGFDPNGVILDSNVLEHRETPGLGDKICKTVNPWNEQFKDINPAEINIKVRQDGGQLDAITAATITARAYSDAIQRAYDTYMNYKITVSEMPDNEEINDITSAEEQEKPLANNENNNIE